MTDTPVTRYLESEVEALEPFAAVAMGPAGSPLNFVEVMRRADSRLEVRVPGRIPGAPALPVRARSLLHERGFASADPANPSEPWSCEATDGAAAVALARRVLTEVFAEKPDVALDVIHASHRAEHEARQKLAEMRERIERILTAMNERRPEQDDDGDYLIKVGAMQVGVAPRVAPGGPAVARVFAITNAGVTVTPELGLFLARLNFGLMFGRFALDIERRAIWFDETLLGDQFTDEELRFTIQVVASTAEPWSERLKQMFGGAAHAEVLAGRPGVETPRIKPGQGGYL